MRFRLFPSLTPVPVLLILACSPDPTAPATEPEAIAPSLSNGSLISRLEVPQLFAAVDFERNLSAVFGILPSEAGAVCDGSFVPYDISQVLDVLKPTGANKVNITDKEQQIVVWEGTPAPGVLVSCTFEGVTPLAIGTVRSVYTDPNLFLGPAPGVFPFHYRATGTLTSPTTGEHYQALIKVSGVVTPEGGLEFYPDVIKLTPTGKP